jgi:uncharacterized paraquat-inducible protein A
MSQIQPTRERIGHRYNWCPSCDELWLVALMRSAGVAHCPKCDGPVLAYIGRSPYDVERPQTDEERARQP